MYKLFLVFAALCFCALAQGDIVVTPHQSDCLPFTDNNEGIISHEVIGCTLFVYHKNVVTNCCLEYRPAVTVDGETITITEIDTGPPCDCICPFDLVIAIDGLEQGAYEVIMEAFHQPDPVSFSVTIPICEDYLISAPQVWAAFGTTGVEVPVLATHIKPIQGFSFGTFWPCRVAQMADIHIKDTITERIGAEFIHREIHNGAAGDDAHNCGWATFAVILDWESPFEGQTIPPGNDQHIATLVYDIGFPQGSVPRSMSVPFAAGLGKPPVSLVYAVEGRDVVPAARSGIIQLTWPPTFIRGDVNDDTNMSISDPIYLLSFLFDKGEEPPCMDAADGNDDGRLDLSDAVTILDYLFNNGEIPPPSPPGPAGYDPTPDSLGCEREAGTD